MARWPQEKIMRLQEPVARVTALVALVGALVGCGLHVRPSAEPFSYTIDPTVVASSKELVAAVDDRGRQFEYAPDQLVVHPRDRAALDAFVARYHGSILVDGSKPRTLDTATAPATGFYLVRVDPTTSTLDDLAANGQRSGEHGRVRFSSEGAARLAALVVRERPDLDVGVNIAMHGNDFVKTANVLENPDGSGGFVDFAKKPYMQLARVIQAWDYLEYKGIPFGPVPWHAPTIAIVDGGFELDGNGVPIGNNPDFDMARVRQLEETVDASGGARRRYAGGTNPGSCTGNTPCPWHGTGTFSTAAAVPYNRFGAAGTASNIPKIILIRANAGLMFEVADGVADAALMGADVINLSIGTGPCGSFCGYIAANAFTDFQAVVYFASGYSLSTVVASAGNSNESNEGQYDNVPCTLDGVLCVGATNSNGVSRSYSGRGSRVHIWAPDCIDVTPVPVNATTLSPSLGVFCGTSASAPFVSGIVALMKALQPSLYEIQVTAILQATASKSTDPLVKPGVIDALAALQQIKPNLPPTVQITSHKDNQQVTIKTDQNFIATIADPELEPNHIEGMTTGWSSDKQGPLCVTNNCNAKLTSLGAHKITATVTDGWGASASQTITLVVTAGPPPKANITWPDNNATFSASQQIELRGNGFATTEPIIPDARLAWASDRDGALGTGGDRLVKLSVGLHHITLTATDSFGQTGNATITVNVIAGKDVPTAQILQPADFASVAVNAALDLVGKGTDPVDGDLPDARLTWSDANGVLGTGKHIVVHLPGPACGPIMDTITLRVRNKAGKTAETSIRVYIGPVC